MGSGNYGAYAVCRGNPTHFYGFFEVASAVVYLWKYVTVYIDHTDTMISP